ncbi:inorganic diphosphatase [Candidatus Parcubacteria bacterium]|nr:inorganic diphosphatase [Candidatus Parcubacteria bacterium]
MNLSKDIKPGENVPEEINVIVEIPKGSKNKYEIDEETGAICLDRALYSSVYFPFEYGSIPQTASEDGDPLDIVLLATNPTFPGCLVKARPIGVLLMEDEAGVDNKVVVVPKSKIDPRFSHVNEYTDLTEHQQREIKEFFETYKRLEPNKFVKITGWEGVKKAKEIITQAVQKYKKV